MYDFLFDLMVRDPTIVPLEPVNVVLSASRVDSKVKEFGIGITLSDFCDTRALLLPRHLNRGKADDTALEASPKVPLLHRKGARVLSNVRAKDDEEGFMKV